MYQWNFPTVHEDLIDFHFANISISSHFATLISYENIIFPSYKRYCIVMIEKVKLQIGTKEIINSSMMPALKDTFCWKIGVQTHTQTDFTKLEIVQISSQGLSFSTLLITFVNIAILSLNALHNIQTEGLVTHVLQGNPACHLVLSVRFYRDTAVRTDLQVACSCCSSAP